jgi:tetratricopeptide (TPR) repeat protein
MKNKRVLFFILTLIIVNFLLNIKTLNYSFVEDDYPLIVNNNRIKDINLLVNSFKTPFFKATEHPYLHYWRPAILFSYYIDYKIWNINPKGFHLTNILIHTINILLFFLLLGFFTKKWEFAFLSAIVFSIHPAHVENISWISGRTDLLAIMFLLLTTLFLYFALKDKKKSPVFFLISLLFFSLALLSKEIAVIFPAIIFSFFLIVKKIKKGFPLTIPYGLLTLGFIFIHNRFSKAQTLFENIKLSDTKIILKTIGVYFKLLFFPFVKAPLYSMKNFDKESFLPFVLFIIFIFLVFLIIKNRYRFQTSFFSLPLLFFLIPIINPKIISSYPPIALRFIYATSLFSVIFLAELIFLLLKNKRFKGFIIIFLFLFTGYIHRYLYFQGFYKNGFERADRFTRVYPAEGIYKIQSALFYAKKKSYEKALDLVEKAITLNKNNSWVNIKGKGMVFKANLLILTGKSKKAKLILNKMIIGSKEKEIKYYCYLTLAKLYEKGKEYKTALSYLEKGEQLFKTSDLYFRKSLIFYYLGDYEKALNSLEKAKKIDSALKNYSALKRVITDKLKKTD